MPRRRCHRPPVQSSCDAPEAEPVPDGLRLRSPRATSPAAIAALADGIDRRRPLPDAARHHRVGQERHHRLDHRAGAAAHAGHRPQQVAGRPAGQRVPRVLPRQPGRVLRQLLRLLPARGLHRLERHLHREGLVGQRRDRPAAPLGHGGAAHPARRHRRGLGVVHLRPRLARGVPENVLYQLGRRRDRPAGVPAPARRHAVRAQRHEPRAGASSGCGATPSRCTPPTTRRRAHRAVRRRGRAHHRGRPPHRRADPHARRPVDLPGHALRRRRGAHAGGHRAHRGRAAGAAAPTSRRRASCSRPSGCACARSTTSR